MFGALVHEDDRYLASGILWGHKAALSALMAPCKCDDPLECLDAWHVSLQQGHLLACTSILCDAYDEVRFREHRSDIWVPLLLYRLDSIT